MGVETEWMRVVRETIERGMPQFLETWRKTQEMERWIMSDPERAKVYAELRARSREYD